MKKIYMTNTNEYCLVDDGIYEILRKYKWNKASTGYSQATRNYKCITMHRFIFNFLNKKIKSLHIHHINNNKLDNRLRNLEILTPKEHCKKRRNYNGKGNPFYGKTHTDAVKKIISKFFSKKVFQIDLNNKFIKQWESTMQIQNTLGYSNGNISNACTGRVETAYGFKWKYKI